ncbi:MAG: FkbM family methyltransferase, partial [Hyphomicrobiaceae bacterium]
MWAKRKFRIKLGDLLRPLGMRVTEQVDFGSLRRDIQASHVLDVGVADGTPSLYARFPDAKLDLFEPAKAHIPIVERQVISKRNARLHCVALAEKNGFGVLSRPGSSSATLLPAVHHGPANPVCEPVPVRRLDDLLTRSDIERPCLLKIDTEGTELSVLKGATGIINDIDTIVVEVHFRRRNT